MVLQALAFIALFALLQLLWQAARGSALESFVVHDGTVRPAAGLVNLLTPAVEARAVGSTLLGVDGAGLNVLNGCEGTEALLLLAAAFAVVPMPWRRRLAGLAVGVAVVFVVNQARILVLFYANRGTRAWFEMLHSVITPLAVVLLVAAYFYAWLAWSGRRVAAAS
jgi:exosortase/archaeosortase family protein